MFAPMQVTLVSVEQYAYVAVPRLHRYLQRRTAILPQNVRLQIRKTKATLALTTSVMLESQSGWLRKCFTISMCPCSAAHIRAVLPSSSWMLMSAPASSSICTMSNLPWLTASISAVWPCWINNLLAVVLNVLATDATNIRVRIRKKLCEHIWQ